MGERMLSLMPWSSLTVRVPDGQIAPLLCLAGKTLSLGATPLQVGVSQARSLIPATALRSRLVVIKVSHTDAAQLTPELFEAAARKQLASLSISEPALLTLGKRRTLRIKQREIVGYEVLVEGLTAEESLAIQEHGLGGRHHMSSTRTRPPASRRIRFGKLLQVM